jgi:hypothetical protein
MRKILPPPGRDTWTVLPVGRNDLKKETGNKYRVKEIKMKEIREHKKSVRTKVFRVKIWE